MKSLILVKGAGELASGVAWRLFRSGFAVVLTEVAQPLAVRRTVSFCEAVYAGHMSVEGITARLVAASTDVPAVLSKGEIPLLVDPAATCRTLLRPYALVDAIMAKCTPDTHITDAPRVIGLGPGFTAGENCHAVVETQRGHYLGRVYYQGAALPDTGVPAERGGYGRERVVRATAPGLFRSTRQIGELVQAGDLLGAIGGEVAVRSAIPGILRGLIHDNTPVTPGLKIGDVDPFTERERCHTISDKALSVAGGVLEALMVLR